MKRVKKKVSFESNQYVKTFDKLKPSNELSETKSEPIMTIKPATPPPPPSPSPAPVDNKKKGDMSIIMKKKSPDKTPSKKSPVKSETKSPKKSETKSPKKSKKSPPRGKKN